MSLSLVVFVKCAFFFRFTDLRHELTSSNHSPTVLARVAALRLVFPRRRARSKSCDCKIYVNNLVPRVTACNTA